MPEDSTEVSEDDNVPPPSYKIKVQIDYEEGDMFGVKLDKNLMVEKIEREMRADGVLEVGDVIVSVNDIKVEDEDHFYKKLQLISRLYPQVHIEVDRKVIKSPLNDVRAKSISLSRKRKCEYFIAHIHRINNVKLGLSIKHRMGTVIVTRCEPESLVNNRYKEGDRIVDVDGHRVFTKDDAKDRIVNGLRCCSYISTVVERKMQGDEQPSERALLMSCGFTEPKMPSDAANIGQREIAAIKSLQGQPFPLKSILRTDNTTNTTASSLQFGDKPMVMRVACDTDDIYNLIHVKKRNKPGFFSSLFRNLRR